MESRLIHGDCLEEMEKLIEQGIKVDAIITDLPYGITACKWDTIIPFDYHIKYVVNKKERVLYKNDFMLYELSKGKSYKWCVDYFEENKKIGMWGCIKQIRKDKTPVVLFGSEPFSSYLRMSNIREFKYDWIWEKEKGNNFLILKYQPMKEHEIISVFYKHNYYPVMQKRKGDGEARAAHNYVSVSKKKMNIYNFTKRHRNKGNDKLRYPSSVQKFNTEHGYHDTQKPVALLEYFLNTYTKEGDTVLDFTMGSGTTGVVCKNLNRGFIGIEKEQEYIDMAYERIKNTQQELLF